MRDGPNIVNIAAMIGDHARAEVLTVLMSGMALTATELADAAGVTRQTISAHLAKLAMRALLASRPRAGTATSASPTPRSRSCWNP
jgi:predicted ArsR family transcriptional regulator